MYAEGERGFVEGRSSVEGRGPVGGRGPVKRRGPVWAEALFGDRPCVWRGPAEEGGAKKEEALRTGGFLLREAPQREETLRKSAVEKPVMQTKQC